VLVVCRFIEEVSPTLSMKMQLESITFDKKSEFQRAQIISTAPFGKTLVLDGKTQSALADEYVYHESLVHPAMLAHPAPKSVFIGGGGELATAREVLKHAGVEKCVMVDIDEIVVNICKEELPEWHGGCIHDARLHLAYDDAKAWLERTDEKFDVVIMDIADPIEAGPGYVLYTQEFYNFVTSRMNPGGILVTQSGPGSVMNIHECCTVIHNTLRSTFTHVVPYTADVPSFGCNWAFNMAFNDDAAVAQAAAAAGVPPQSFILTQAVAEVDATIEARITGDLRFMDGVAMKGILGVPKSARKALAEETRVMTVADPVFMY
jgi:spermidine synthase